MLSPINLLALDNASPREAISAAATRRVLQHKARRIGAHSEPMRDRLKSFAAFPASLEATEALNGGFPDPTE